MPTLKEMLIDLPSWHPLVKANAHLRNIQEKDFDWKFVYILKCNDYYKIGRAHNLESRLVSLQCGNPYPLEVVAVQKVRDSVITELLLQIAFLDKRHIREWYKLDNDDLEEAKKYLEYCGRLTEDDE